MRSLTLAQAALLLAACCLLRLSEALPNFARRVPNGNGVPSPCNPAEVWPGVGHFSQAGGGPRNPFGLDFKAAEFKWTQELCRKDSDGDGKSNGEELGDPDCVWNEGSAPSRTTGLSHPGICEPVGSEKCAHHNGHFRCAEQFNCTAMHQPGVRKMNMRFQRTPVPPKETTYMCQAFEVSNLTKEHMIASVPIIDNPNVLHHMIIYGCSKKPDVKLDEPFECGMSAAGCFNLVDLWGLGMRAGNCYRDNVGAPFGIEGYQYVVLQLHWNNPTGVRDWFDASGFDVYFSPALRQYDTGVMMYGQVKLDLAPRQTEIYRTFTCDRRCSEALLPPTGYKLLWGTLHMHLFGVRGQVTLWRGGQKVRDLIPMHKFDYDTPVVFEYSEPIDYLPGDEIKTDCYFSTANHNRSVYWGESTQEEMCYGFFQYYPHNRTKALAWPNVDMCTGFGKIDYCTMALPKLDKYYVDNCDIREIQSGKLVPRYRQAIQSECYQNHRYRCSDQCLAWYRQAMKTEPCFQNDSRDFLNFHGRYGGKAAELVTYLDMCAERDQRELLLDAQKKIDELSKRPPPPPPTNPDGMLSFDVRLLIVSGAYLAGLLLAALLVIVILKGKKKVASVGALDEKSFGSGSSRL